MSKSAKLVAIWAELKERRQRIFRRSLSSHSRPRPKLFFESLEARRVLATLTWDGGAGTFNWLEANNWDTNTVPTSSDDVIVPDLTGTPTIFIGSNATARSVTSAEKFQIGAGTLALSQNSSFSNGFDVFGSGISSAATTVIAGASTWEGATLSGNGTIENSGTVTFDAGTLTVSSPVTLSNTGTILHSSTGTATVSGGFVNAVGANYNITANSGGLNAFASTPGVVNLGTITRSAGSGTFNFDASIVGTPTMRNGGTVNIQTGSATWLGAGNVIHTGAFNLSSGTTLTFSNGTSTFGTGSSISGLGTAVFNTGTFNVTDNVLFSSAVTMSGGTLAISTGTLTLSGSTTLSSGAFSGTGALVISGTANINSATAPSFAVTDTTLSGTVNHSGTAAVAVTGNFTINSGGQYLVTANSGGLNVSGGSTSSIINNGLIRRSAGTGTFNFNASIVGTPTVSNRGSVLIETGSATWQGASDSTQTGTFSLSTGTVLTFSNGITTFGTGSSITGSGTAVFNAGTFNVTDDVSMASAVTMSGGTLTVSSGKTLTLSGSVDIASGTIGGAGAANFSGVVNVATSSAATLAASSMSISGVVNHSGTASVGVTGNLILEATSQYTITAASGGLNVSGGATSSITNRGSIRRTAGSGNFTFNVTAGGSPTFTNEGTIDLQTGTGTLQAGSVSRTHIGTFTIASGTTFTFSGGGSTTNFGIGSSITGGGTVAFTAGTYNVNDNMTVNTGVNLAGMTLSTASGKTLTLGGTVDLNSGTVSGAGAVVFANTSTVNVSGTSTVTFSAASTTLAGTLSHSGTASLTFTGPLLIASTGQYLITATSGGLTATGAGAAIINQGLMRRTAGSGTFLVTASSAGTPTPSNQGTVDLQSGATTWNANSNTTHTGSFQVGATASLTFTSGTQSFLGSTFTGSGTTTFSSGTINLSGTVTIATSAALSGSAVSVATGSTAVFAGTTTWSAGALSATGTGKYRTTGTFTVGGNVSIGGRLENAGTVTVSGANSLTLSGASSVLANESTGTIDLTGTAATPIAGATGSIISAGLFRQTSSSSLTVAPPVNNLGTVYVTAGTLNLNGTVSQATTSTLTGGTWTVTATGTLNLPAAAPSIVTIGAGAVVQLSGTFAKLNSLASNQGTFELSRSFTTAGGLSNSGQLTVIGGSALTVSGAYTQSAGQTMLGSSVSLTGTIVSNTNTITLNGGSLAGFGTMTGNVSNAAVIAPGASPGAITINGNYTQTAGGMLNIEIGGVSAVTPDFDQLAITGQAVLDGTLNVTLIGGFWADKQDSFRFMTYASRTGDFATINLPQVNARNLLSVAPGSTFYDLLGTTLIVKNLADSGLYSLRDRISVSNAASDADVLFFQVAGTIQPLTALPALTQSLTIDGRSVPGYSGIPLVDIQGSLIAVPSSLGLNFGAGSSGSSLYALMITQFTGDGVSVASSGNTIAYSYVGVDTAMGTGSGNQGNGISILAGTNNLIQNNVISANGATGVLIEADGNKVQGNKIGTDVNGSIDLGNSLSGVWMYGGSSNVIGVDGDGVNDAAEGNVISGNNTYGVYFQGASWTNTIAGNKIGTDVLGSTALGNTSGGIAFFNDGQAQGNIIGTDSNGVSDVLERNVISGNSNYGIVVFGPGTIIAGNYVGVGSDGSTPLGNVQGGISVAASAVQVGRLLSGAGNVISGNSGFGVAFSSGASNSSAQGNIIGLNAAGNATVPNGSYGIDLFNASQVTIGGTTSSARNVIGGNSIGVLVHGTSASQNLIQGNYIGADASGSGAAANGLGVQIASGAKNNTIGGTVAGAGNVISGNTGDGVLLTDSGTDNNVIAGNLIGLNAAGSASLGNGANGVDIGAGPTGNLVGGSTSGARNVISGNSSNASFSGSGVFLQTASGNMVAGNFIGLNSAGTAAVPNRFGVYLRANASNNIVGTNADGSGDSGERNVIGGNSIHNVLMEGATSNILAGNYIGSDAAGTTGFISGFVSLSIQGGSQSNIIGYKGTGDPAVQRNMFLRKGMEIRDGGSQFNRVAGNTFGFAADNQMWTVGDAITILLAATDNIIGSNLDGQGDAAEGNVVGGYNRGIYVWGSGTENNLIAGNRIGTNIEGTAAVGNTTGIEIADNAISNTIGGSSAAARNIISGNTQSGIYLRISAVHTFVEGNFIGTDITGTSDLGNGQNGLYIDSTNNFIGGLAPGSGNVISGNDQYGLFLHSDANHVYGNLIGTNASGTAAVGNELVGILVQGSTNTIGGPTAAHRNIISGTKTLNQFGSMDSGAGLVIYDGGFLTVEDNMVQGNYIGTDITGTAAIPNYRVGLSILIRGSAVPNIIGGELPGEGNLISGNGTFSDGLSAGIVVWGGNFGDYIAGNRIGTNVAGTAALPNAGSGVFVYGTRNFAFGGNSDLSTGVLRGEGNLVSGNLRDGVQVITGDNSVENSILAGNFIGTDITGTYAIPNGGAGVVTDGTSVMIGGGTPSTANLISGNLHGIIFSGGSGSIARGNLIGTDRTGAAAIPNSGFGVWSRDPALNSTIGGTNPGEGNLISGNTLSGVFFSGNTTTGHVVVGNIIGLNQAGTAAIPNGIGVGMETFGNTVGGSTAAERNIISGNTVGVRMERPNNLAVNENNRIIGNYIGTDVTGSYAIGNGTGVQVTASVGAIVRQNTIGGTAAGLGNVISGNTTAVEMDGAGASSNLLIGNSIGTDASQSQRIANGQGVVIVSGAHDNVIGGVTAGSGNLIGGSVNEAVFISGATTDGNLIQGNSIGSNAAQTRSFPNRIGVRLGSGVQATVGGDTAAAGNIIASASQVGLMLDPSAASSGVFGNNLYLDNLGMAVDIGASGANPNDAGDGDGVLNAPALMSAALSGNNLIVEGVVGAGRTIELFKSAPSYTGFGVGQILLGRFTEGAAEDELTGTQSYGPQVRGITVGTDIASRFRFTIPLPPDVQFGSLLTALALGSTSEFSSTITVGDVAGNLAPVITLPASIVLSVGDTLAVAGSFTDDDSTQWTASVDYGDGGGFEPLALEQDGSFNLAHQYNAAASVPYSVRVRIVDGGGRSSERVMSVAVQGTGPVVQFNQFSITSIVNEGGEVSLKGAFTDNDVTVSHEVSVEWGDGTSSSFTTAAGVQSFTTTHVYVDDGDVNASTATPRDSYRVAVTVIDPAHRRDTTPDGLYIVEVDNVKPTAITLTGLPSVIQEGSVVQFGGTFFDPGLRDSHTIVVDWGDGSPVQTVLLPSSLGQTSTRSFSVPPHLYRNNPTAPQTAYNVLVSVGDDDEPATPTTVTRSLTVANATPTFSSIVLSPTTIVEGGSAALDILFADPGENDSHEILVNWGDGSPEESYQRPAGVNTLTLPGHRYADNRPANASIPVTVRLRDADMPAGVYVSAVRNVTVTNVAPTLSALQLYARTSAGQWTALPMGAHIAENTQLRMLGHVTDPGSSDVLTVDVAWGSGLHLAADVDSGDGTFEAQFTITDDFGVGTAFDLMTLLVTASDGDGGASSATVDIQVDNTAPTVTVLPDRVVDPQWIPLMSIVDEPSLEDRAHLHYDWRAEGSAGTQIGHDAGFTLDRNLVGPGVIRVTLVVSDDDLGSSTFTSAMMFGTQNADQLVIDDSTFTSANVSSIMVLSLAGSDIIDGTGVTNPAYSLILDGGNDTDLLYGGAGNDTFLLRGGNDSANVPGSVVPAPNEAGNDRYLLVPNSVLTVYDNSGDNSLDFSLANFNLSSQPTLGVTFDLSLVSPTLAVQQDVAPTPGTADTHFVTARGSFSDLIGSFFNDTLTTASGATVDAGAGSDRLVVKSGTIGGSISGGADTDTFSITGTGISGISFEGDDGADVFQVASGSSISNIDFGGGADTDTFTISAASLIGISFEGDSGADVFDVEPGAVLTGISFGGGADDDVFNVGGAVLAEVSFEGDSGADVFTVGTSTSLAGISFSGGADNDVFVIPSGSTLSGISFEGDSGSDVFQVSTGVGLSGIFFGGGADDDTFTIADGVSLINISFEGDSGADDLIVFGTVLGGISFSGGADDDVFTVGTTSSVGGISFEGDSGADDLIVLGTITGGIEFGGGADTDVLQIGGTVLGTIDFSGGADKDVFTVGTGAEIGGISFEGDSGADELIVGGLLTGSIYFGGGADDDVLSIGGTVIGNIDFGGGADSDVFQVLGSGEVGSISFEGDSGADHLVVLGTVTGGIDFGGGADDDVFAVGGTVVGGIEFSGGADDDVFSVTGTVSGGITFGGGADDDVFSAGGIITGSISFEGDTGNDSLLIRGTANAVAFIGDSGADVFSVTGSVGSIEFGGGADDDVLSISGTVIGNIEFSGGADDDVFSSTGSVGSISFEGDSGADDLLVAGSVGTIEFNGGADSDTLVNRASGVTWIRFSGFGAGATGTDDKDVFVNLGSEIGEISFEGDSGADVFVSLGSDLAKIEFGGGADNDVFVVDGTSIGGIFFEGGADDDVLSVSGTSIGTISFEGDDGSGPGGAADTFVNRSSGALDSNGVPIGTIVFNGYAGNDAFRNDGAIWKSVTYTGGGDNDVFQNNGSSLLLIDFEGDSGADVFENNGTSIGQIEFFGGADKDVFASDGSQISQIVFYGGADSDLLINSGSQIAAIDFAGAEGSDTLFNSGTEVDRIAFQGDAGDDRLVNSGASVSNVSFYGGAGSDWFYNRSTAVNASGLSMYAGGTMMQPTLSQFGSEVLLNQPISNAGSIDDADDFFLNEASSISGIYFEGGADDDVFQSSGTNVSGISFEGDAGNDQLLNMGADVIGLLFNGGTGNDSLELRGLRVDDVMFDGGDDADTLISRGADAGEIHFSGGAGIDTWANWGAGARLLDMSGGTEGDRFQNNGSRVESILFTGGDGDDALQQNGDSIGSVIMFGDDGADTLFNNGSDISSIALTGGSGADTLVNSGNRIGAGSTGDANYLGLWMQGGDGPDLLRTSGTDVVSITFFGDAGEDALLVNSSGQSVSFDGGDDSDVLTLRGTIESAEAFGGDGDDRLVVAGEALAGASLGTVILHGGAGNDRYEFVGAPQGKYLLDEPSSSSTDTSDDGIDFSSYTAGAVNLDLAVVSPQSLSAGLMLQLSSTSVNAIESVIGSSFADVVYGNDRNNYLAGAEFYTGSMPAIAAEKNQTQWVLLDFDSATDGFEHVYSLEERQAIIRRLETTYYGLRPDGSTRSFYDSDRWFNIRFALSASELPSGTTPTVLVFNETPSTGRPGGESSEIDPGNLTMSGRAVIQVNGLLGGIEAAPKGDFMLQIPEDGEQNYGNVKPPATVDNFIALSSKIAAHELAHMLGLRHYDAFGPIGFGIHSPPGAASFKPEYQGSSAAFETFDHIIGSPASVGSSRFNDIGNLFFGEREAVKLAYGMSDTSQTTLVESSLTTAHNTFAAAAVLPVVTLSVPNTLSSGLNSDKSFYVQAAAVIGSIGLDASGHSENDYYRFSGRRGDLVTIEVSSQSLRRYLNLGLSGTIDSVVRLRYADGRIVSFAGRDAENDDEFESSDSLLMDVELPETGDYIIEVDTFSRGPRSTDPTSEQLALLSPEARQLLADTLNDTDTGNYQLFVYNFAKANAVSALDKLVGRDGVDVIELGGSFASGPVIDSYSSTQSSIVNQAFTAQLTFSDDGGNLWTATVDYGDGNAPITMAVTPTGGIPLNAVYSSVGTKSVHVIVTNDDGVTAEALITVNVVAATPVPVIESISDNALEGNVITVVGSASQEGLSGAIALTWTITRVVGSDSIPVSNGSGASYSFTALDDGVYNIVLTATNSSGVAASVSQLINVANLAPVPTIATVSSPLQEGTSITATGSATDAGVNDSPSLAWSVYVVTGAGSTLVSSGSGATFTFTPVDNGTYRIDLTATDKDGASGTVSSTLSVANLAPVPTITTLSSPLQEGTSITATGSATDAGVNDSPLLAWSVYVVTGAGSTLVSSGSGATITFTPADNGTYRIDLTATDKDGASGTVSRTLSVANLAPVPTITTLSSPLQEGTSITAAGSATDAGVNDSPSLAWSVYVVTGSGSTLVSSGSGATFTFTPADNGTYRIDLTATDKDGASGTVSRTLSVANLAPVPTITTLSSPLQEGTSITANGSATDAGVNDSPSLAWSVYVVTGSGSTLVSSGSGATITFTPADNGTYRIDLTATDKDGAAATVSRTVNVANVTPSASLTLNVGSTVTVGTSITATLSASDPAGVNDPLAYSWVITKDGSAYATQTGGTTYTFTPSAAGSYVLSVTVNDGDGGLVTAASTVTVAPVTSGNTPPTVAITTPINGVFKEMSWLRFTATDVDVVDQNGTFKYVINWGDGLSETVFAGRSLLRGHVYDRVSSSGSFTVSATATDARGATGPTAAIEFVVSGWTLMPDPINIGKAILVIVGSQQDDNIKVKTKDDDYYQVTIVARDNDVRRRGTIYGDVDRILVFAQDGNDHVMLDDDIDIPAEVWGGAGDDDIKGGSGNDILLGESGNDNLWGGDGRDIVIGGIGADRIHGDANDDILVAGFTAFEAEFNRSAPSAFAASSRLTFEQQRSALEAVMAEWASNRSVTTRRQNILGVGTGTRANGNTFFRTSDSVMTNNTVFDDNEVDKLWGDDGTDWFFANLDPVRGGVLDDIKERKGSEFIEDLDKWW